MRLYYIYVQKYQYIKKLQKLSTGCPKNSKYPEIILVHNKNCINIIDIDLYCIIDSKNTYKIQIGYVYDTS